MPIAEDIANFRRFTRMYTRFVGTLQEGLLNTEYSLAEARVLYELANRDTPKAKEVAEALGLDTGYLSRILAKFEGDGLLKRTASKQDGRYAELALTRQGRAAFRKLNTRSDKQARSVLEGLPPADRAQLIGSMRTIENVLSKEGRPRPGFVLRQHRAGDMGWVVAREAAVYFEEYGFDAAFEALVARIVADFLANFDAARERCWIAEVDGTSAGHIFLVKHPEHPDTAKLRLLFVEPDARGMGLGHALVKECVGFARSAGYRRVVLWTQSNLAAAHRVYVGVGFRLVQQERHHSFGQDLVGETWELEL
jgi:DNA-binding MarR family transcriptional regulator/GNAT superfamily N-acetyltransferase